MSEPGEGTLFEGLAEGWPPLTWRAALLYAVLLAFAAAEAFNGEGIVWTYGSTRVSVSAMLAASVLVALIECVRFARFRSRLYVVTPMRVVVSQGIQFKRTWWIARERVLALALDGGRPILATDTGVVRLDGLDRGRIEALAIALGWPVVIPDLRRARRARLFALALGVLAVAAVETLTAVERRAATTFFAAFGAFNGAVAAARAATIATLTSNLGVPVTTTSGAGSFSYSNFAHGHSEFDVRLAAALEETPCVDVRVVCDRSSTFEGTPSITIAPRGARRDAVFVEALHRELAKVDLTARGP